MNHSDVNVGGTLVLR